ncbi:uncharacterized protein EDB91DRAFT_301042 [Suillus paluster]|uniref:uncharacterized protein n=1 Tax=Suillus paluster TaxID=48578 RepID=UPI001B88523F|nr:uncharacterized protein EDB91DRAFT_301042 [Suillus paluster]KAG1721205.1 hypothetical protein EDB91DRAFT_301042 [Suillus paluster]
MEETLGTLEEMAGEIGASVIVVKEIEVPAEVSGVVEDWGGDGRKRRRQRQLMGDDSETTTTTETEPEPETTDVDDDPPPTNNHVEMFCMDEDGDSSLDSAAFILDLEIATVYKPRPFRRRVASTVQGYSDRRKGKGKKPKHLLAHTCTQPNSHSEHHTHHSHHSNIHNHPDFTHSTEPQTHLTSENKQSKRRAARDKRREAKHNPLLLHVPTTCIHADELVSGLESFHVTLELEDLHPASASPEVETSVHDDAHLDSPAQTPAPETFISQPDPSVIETHYGLHPPIIAEPYQQTQPVTNEPESPTEIILISSKSPAAELETEPRLIVEALVVRKMSLEEAFLDFGGFSVC